MTKTAVIMMITMIENDDDVDNDNDNNNDAIVDMMIIAMTTIILTQ